MAVFNVFTKRLPVEIIEDYVYLHLDSYSFDYIGKNRGDVIIVTRFLS